MTQNLDSIPYLGILALLAVVTFVGYEIGFRAGHWWQSSTANEAERPTGVLIGSLLALMAFLLAVTMQMAVDRYDTRRAVVQAEANAIGTTYLRAGYLPQRQGGEVRDLLRAYVPLCVTNADPEIQAANIERAEGCRDHLDHRSGPTGQRSADDQPAAHAQPSGADECPDHLGRA